MNVKGRILSPAEDLLGGHLDTIRSKFEGDGYDWRKVQEAISEIRKQEGIDEKLETLAGNADEYYAFLKGKVEELKANEVAGGLADKAGDFVLQAGETAEKAKERLTKRAEETLEASLGAKGIWGKAMFGIFSFLKKKEAAGGISGFFAGLGLGLFGKMFMGDSYQTYKDELERISRATFALPGGPAVGTPDAGEGGAGAETPEAKLAEAKASAKAEIETSFAGYKKEDYDDANWTRLLAIKDKGIGDIQEVTLSAGTSEIDSIKVKTLVNMRNIPRKSVPENKEVLKSSLYSLGMSVLFQLSSYDVDKKTILTKQVFLDIKRLTFEQIKKLCTDFKNNPRGLLDAEIGGERIFSDIVKQGFSGSPEDLLSILEKVSSDNSRIILKDMLSNNNLKELISKYDLVGRGIVSSDLKTRIDSGADYTKLTAEEFGTLLIYSLPLLGILSMTKLSNELLSNIKLIVGNPEVDQLKEELDIVKGKLISPQTMAFLFNIGGINFGGSNTLLVSLDAFKNTDQFKQITPESDKIVVEGDLRKLIKFKDEVLPKVVDNVLDTNGMEWDSGEKERLKERFKEKLDYRGVIGLYILLGGKENIDFLNIDEESYDKGLFYTWIISVLKGTSEGAALETKLLKKYTKTIVDKDKEKGIVTIIINKLIAEVTGDLSRQFDANMARAGEIIRGHEFVAGTVLTGVALFYFKRAKIIGGVALVGAIYLFTSGALDSFKEDPIYLQIEDLLTDGHTITIERALENAKGMISFW